MAVKYDVSGAGLCRNPGHGGNAQAITVIVISWQTNSINRRQQREKFRRADGCRCRRDIILSVYTRTAAGSLRRPPSPSGRITRFIVRHKEPLSLSLSGKHDGERSQHYPVSLLHCRRSQCNPQGAVVLIPRCIFFRRFRSVLNRGRVLVLTVRRKNNHANVRREEFSVYIG